MFGDVSERRWDLVFESTPLMEYGTEQEVMRILGRLICIYLERTYEKRANQITFQEAERLVKLITDESATIYDALRWVMKELGL